MSATDSPAVLHCDAEGCDARHDAEPITWSRNARRWQARLDDGWQISLSGSDGMSGPDLCPEHKEAR